MQLLNIPRTSGQRDEGTSCFVELLYGVILLVKLGETSLEDVDAVVHALYQVVACHIVLSRCLGRVVCCIVYSAGWEMNPSIFDPVYEDFIGDVKVDNKVDGLVLLVESV